MPCSSAALVEALNASDAAVNSAKSWSRRIAQREHRERGEPVPGDGGAGQRRIGNSLDRGRKRRVACCARGVDDFSYRFNRLLD